MDKIQALYNFWSGFGLPAYEENSVPDNAEMPYITYEVQAGNFYSNSVPLTASLWYYSPLWVGISQKAEEIQKTIGIGGYMLSCDSGCLWIKQRHPFIQNVADTTNDKVKRIILSVSVDFITEN